MTMTEAKRRIIDAGYRVSCGSFEDDRIIYACSVETYGPATYGHPWAEVQIIKATGIISATNC